MSALTFAIPEIAARTGRDVIIVGGLAVVCRLTHPYRATSDLDTVNRRAIHEAPQLELLVASGAIPSGVSGVLVPTEVGPVQVDILEVTDSDLAELYGVETRVINHVMSHAWAAASATPVILKAAGIPELETAVAQVGPLIAMKLQAMMNRGSAKEGTDLLDITRLCLDPLVRPIALEQLATADTQLRSDAALHAARWFEEYAGGTLFREVIHGLFVQKIIRPNILKQETDPAVIETILNGALPQVFGYLESSIRDDFIVGEQFTIADLAIVHAWKADRNEVICRKGLDEFHQSSQQRFPCCRVRRLGAQTLGQHLAVETEDGGFQAGPPDVDCKNAAVLRRF